MITIHAIMLVSLGFLSAVLLGLVIVPAYRRRVARLTREEIKQAMPLTEQEIRADKDRLRADYAIVIHEINAKLEKSSLYVARQRVEINRRDAAISGLEGEVSQMRTSLDEHENARRVLEHTIMDRLPKVEQRLLDARKLLTQRDREIAKLSTASVKRLSALDEAIQINAQNRDEIHRLNASLTTREARARDGRGNGRFDGEVALRSEIEALRAQMRDQAGLIARLQGLLQRAGGAVAAGALTLSAAGGKGFGAALSGGGVSGSGKPEGSQTIYRAEDEIARLRNDLADAESALRSAKTTEQGDEADRSAMATELRVVKAQNEDQGAEIAKLKASLLAYQSDDANERAIPEGKVAMHARISELSAVVEKHSSTIGRLRAEVAAGNEKLARQALHFTDEMRRLGAGSMPMAMPKTGRSGVASGAVQTGGQRTGSTGSDRGSLSDRISDPRQRYDQRGGAYGELTRSRSGSGSAGASAVASPRGEAIGLSGRGSQSVGGTLSQVVEGEVAAPEVSKVAGKSTGTGIAGPAAPVGVVSTMNASEAVVEITQGKALTGSAMAGASSGDTSAPTGGAGEKGSRLEARRDEAAEKSASNGFGDAATETNGEGSSAKKADGDDVPAPRRGGLLDRITRMDSSK